MANQPLGFRNPRPAEDRPQLDVEIELGARRLRITCSGQLVVDQCSQLTRLADAVLGDSAILEIVLNLSDVTYLDSSGLGVLLSIAKRFREHGGKAVVEAASPIVRSKLAKTRLDSILPVLGEELNSRPEADATRSA